MLLSLPHLSFSSAVVLILSNGVFATSLYQDGQSGRAAALGGIEAAGAQRPIEALASNPAGLTATEQFTVDLGFTAGFVDGTFSNPVNRDATMSDTGVVPKAALGWKMGAFRFGMGVVPDITARADWRFVDRPGGADGLTTYGSRTHLSEIVLIRTALGAALEITPEWSLGAGIGILYNSNRLEAPYIFQSQPVLRGAKVLLDLETEGWGMNAQFGLLWRPNSRTQVGLSYTTEGRIHSEGRAHANADVQFDNLGLDTARPDAAYDAEVINVFPQRLSLAATWQATDRVLIAGQVDWINWANAFDNLEVRLSRGNNRDLNSLLASDKLDDDIPLRWRNQWVFRLGVEYALSAHLKARAGYVYGRNPVPSETLTPLTAASAEHQLSAGIGFERSNFTVDLAWQWELPHEEKVGRSVLSSGEYSGSSTKVNSHWLVLTTGWKF